MQIADSRRPPVSDEEIGLPRMLSMFSGGWPIFRIFIVAGVVAAAAWLIGYARYNPQMVVYSTAFRLDAKGNEAAYYPNGLKFSLHDVLGPSVLDAAYKTVATMVPQLKRSDLDTMVSVVPYSPEREIVRNRYVSMLSERGLSTAERNQIELDFAKALEDAGPEGARIDLSSGAGIVTPAGAAAILQSVLDNWTRIFVTEFGAARRPGAAESKVLIASQIVDTQDYPIVFRHLEKAAGELASRAAEISKLPGTEGISIGGRTLNDVERDAQQIARHSINEELAPAAFSGLSRDPESSAKTLAYASQTIRDSVAELQVQSRLIDELLAQAEPATAGQNRQVAGIPETTVTQLGDTTSDRLIDLAIANAAQPFKQDLLRQKQDIGVRIASLATQLARTERLANALIVTGSIKVSQGGGEFSAMAKKVADDINRLWSELNAMADAASAANLNPSRTLYTRIPLRQEVAVTGGIFDYRGWGGAILIVMLAIAAGVGTILVLGTSGAEGSAAPLSRLS